MLKKHVPLLFAFLCLLAFYACLPSVVHAESRNERGMQVLRQDAQSDESSTSDEAVDSQDADEDQPADQSDNSATDEETEADSSQSPDQTADAPADTATTEEQPAANDAPQENEPQPPAPPTPPTPPVPATPPAPPVTPAPQAPTLAPLPPAPPSTPDDREDKTIYKVVLNHEEQYSIWPANKENALGWKDAGFSGTKEQCLAHIKEVWTDMRPLSLRKKMQEMEKNKN